MFLALYLASTIAWHFLADYVVVVWLGTFLLTVGAYFELHRIAEQTVPEPLVTAGGQREIERLVASGEAEYCDE